MPAVYIDQAPEIESTAFNASQRRVNMSMRVSGMTGFGGLLLLLELFFVEAASRWYRMCVWDERAKLWTRGTSKESMRRDMAVLLSVLMPLLKRAGNATDMMYVRNGEVIAIFDSVRSECGKDGVRLERCWRPRKLVTVRSARAMADDKKFELCVGSLSICELRTFWREVKDAVRDSDDRFSLMRSYPCRESRRQTRKAYDEDSTFPFRSPIFNSKFWSFTSLFRFLFLRSRYGIRIHGDGGVL